MDEAMQPSPNPTPRPPGHLSFSQPRRPYRPNPPESRVHSSSADENPCIISPPKSEPPETVTEQRHPHTPQPLKISQSSGIPSTSPLSPPRVRGSTGDYAFDSIKAVASRHALLEQVAVGRARVEGSTMSTFGTMADPLSAPLPARTKSQNIRSATRESTSSLTSTFQAFPCEHPDTVDLGALITAAGSAENAMRTLLREKYDAAQKYNKLWRLLDKQGAVMSDLNKDLGKITRERDRYKRKLRDQLMSTASGSSLHASVGHGVSHYRDGSESPSVTTPQDGTTTPDSADGSLTSERFIEDYLTQTPPSSAGHTAPSPNSIVSPMYAKPMAAPFANKHDASTDGPESTSVTPRPKQGSFSPVVRERANSTRKSRPAPLDLSPTKTAYAPDTITHEHGNMTSDGDEAKPMMTASGMNQPSSQPDLHPATYGNSNISTGRNEPGDFEISQPEGSAYSSDHEFAGPQIAQAQTYQSLNAPNATVKTPTITEYDDFPLRNSLKLSSNVNTGLPVSPRPTDRPPNSAPPRAPRSPASAVSTSYSDNSHTIFPRSPGEFTFGTSPLASSSLPEGQLRSVRYDSTVAADAPVMGTTVKSPMAPPPVPATGPSTEDILSASHRTISKPTNGVVIQDPSIWGNRREPNLLVKDRPKRSDSENKGRNDRKRSIFGFSGRSPLEIGTLDAVTRRDSPKHRPVFGVPLAEVLEYATPVDVPVKIPAVVYRCLEYLRGMDARSEEGIFRMSGSTVVIKALRDKFDAEGDVRLLAPGEPYHDVHAVASLLKLYLRELPTTLLTNGMHIDFVRCVDLEDKRNMVDALNVMVNRLPAANRELLDKMTAYLREIVDSENVNKMTVRNVGIVFSPTLNIPGKLITALVTEHPKIFGPPVDPDSVDSSLAELLSRSAQRKTPAVSPNPAKEQDDSQARTTVGDMTFPEPPATAKFPPQSYYDTQYSQHSSPLSQGALPSPTIVSSATFPLNRSSSPAKGGRSSIFKKKASIINLNDINISISPLLGGTSPDLSRSNAASHLVTSMSADQIMSQPSPSNPAIITSHSGPVGSTIPSTMYSNLHAGASPSMSGSRSPSAQSASSGSDRETSFGRRLLRRQSGAFLIRTGLVDDPKGKLGPPPPPVDTSKGFVAGGLGIVSPTGQVLGETSRRTR